MNFCNKVLSNDVSLLRAKFAGLRLAKPNDIARECKLIVGATGTTSIGREMIFAMQHGTYLASASSRQIEIDIQALANASRRSTTKARVGRSYELTNGKTIHLLAEGYPVNFYGADSVENRMIDPIMTLLFEGAVELVESKDLEPIIHEGKEVIDESDIASLFIQQAGLLG